MQVVYEAVIGALAVNLTHKCSRIEDEVIKASQLATLDKETNILKEYLEEEQRLKDIAIE